MNATSADRMFERFEQGWPRLPAVFRRDVSITIPELDVRENTNSIVVEAELPGVDEKDVTVTLANGILTIKGEKKHEKEEKAENLPHDRAELRQLRAGDPPPRQR